MLKLVVSIFLFTLPMIVELGQVNRLSKFKLENMRYINFKKFDQVRNLKLPTEQWHNQSLDHFDHANRNTWKQVRLIIFLVLSLYLNKLLSDTLLMIHFLKQKVLYFCILLVSGKRVLTMLYLMQ